MARQFNPKRVLMLLSSHLLEEFFRRRAELTEIPWSKLEQFDNLIVYDAWQALPEERRRQVQVILQDINELADERGLAVLAQEVQWRYPDRLPEFAAVEGRADKALWTYLYLPQAFEEAALFARADALARGRYWVKRNSLPHAPITVTLDKREALGSKLAAYYRLMQGRGFFCQVDHLQRANGDDYFFAYLDDYPDARLVFDDTGRIRRHSERGVFDNVFVFSPTDGTLELYAKGGKELHTPLQEIFCKEALGLDVNPTAPDKAAYHLDGLTSLYCNFPTDPADRIAEVRVRRLRMEVRDQPRRKVTLDSDTTGHKNDIYDMIERYLDSEHLPLNKVRVTLATFRLTFASDGGKPKTLTFNVSHPNSCDLKSKPEEMRVIGERCLKSWGIAQ